MQARTQWTGPWLPTHDRSVSASSKNYWYSAKMQIVIDANTRLAVAISRPTPGNRHDCRAYRDSGVDRQCHGATVMADGGYQGSQRDGAADRRDDVAEGRDRHALDRDDAADHRDRLSRDYAEDIVARIGDVRDQLADHLGRLKAVETDPQQRALVARARSSHF